MRLLHIDWIQNGCYINEDDKTAISYREQVYTVTKMSNSSVYFVSWWPPTPTFETCVSLAFDHIEFHFVHVHNETHNYIACGETIGKREHSIIMFLTTREFQKMKKRTSWFRQVIYGAW